MNAILLLGSLLDARWDVGTSKIDGVFQVRLTNPAGRMTMTESSDYDAALRAAAAQAGFTS